MLSLIGCLIVVGLVCVTISIVTASRIKKGDSDYAADDTQMIQEIYQGLQRMEERIEALETIIMDRVQQERSSHSDSE
jgi:phage shock protein B